MMLHTYTNSIIMKSLKEFIAENLENSTATPVQENTKNLEKQVDENNNQEIAQEDNKPSEH